MADTADWLSLGLGVAQIAYGAIASGSNGVFIDADAMTYHVGDFPAQGEEITHEVLSVNITEGMAGGLTNGIVLPCSAQVALTGLFARGGAAPPVLANVRLWGSHQEGNWGTSDHESEVHFKADALPTPVGTPEDPHLQWQCRLELKVAEGDNAILHFVLDVNQHAEVYATDPHFEYGAATTYPWGQGLYVVYDPREHGNSGS